MSRADPNYDDDLEKIMNEVDDFKIEEAEEEEIHDENVNVDDILNEELVDQTNQTISMTDYGDHLNITDLPPPRLELRGLANSTEHPLEVIEKYERDITARTGTNQTNLDSKFLVTNYEKNLQKSESSVYYQVEQTISDHSFPDEYNNLPSHNDWGAPKCLAVKRNPP